MQLTLTDSVLSLKPNWFERLMWGRKEFALSFDYIESAFFGTAKPTTLLCRKNRVANIPGVLCVGLFYPNGLKNKELWSFSYRHKGILKITMKQGEIFQYVLGMDHDEGQRWCQKILDTLKDRHDKPDETSKI